MKDVLKVRLPWLALWETLDNVFVKALERLFIDWMEQNEDITARYMNEKDFRKIAKQNLLERVHNQIRAEAASA